MKNFEILLFDLDGTVTDSEEGIINSIKFCLNKYGIYDHDPVLLRKFIGPPLVQSLSRYFHFDEKECKIAVEYYREYFSERGLYENKLYPGMYDLLSELYHEGKRIILATAKPTFYARKILNHFKVKKYFHDVVGSNMDGSRMDKAEIIEFILNKNNAEPRDHFIMIGDRLSDIQSAKKFGISTLWVNYGYGDEEELIMADPDYIVDSVNDLYPILMGSTTTRHK